MLRIPDNERQVQPVPDRLKEDPIIVIAYRLATAMKVERIALPEHGVVGTDAREGRPKPGRHRARAEWLNRAEGTNR
jgi:hypothetical protein